MARELERLRKTCLDESLPTGAEMSKALADWMRAGCPGYESEAVGTIEALEVKHQAVLLCNTDAGAPVFQMEPGGPLYIMVRGDDGLYRLHEVPYAKPPHSA